MLHCPVLYTLHWLPVQFRFVFKLVMFVRYDGGITQTALKAECLKFLQHCIALKSLHQLILYSTVYFVGSITSVGTCKQEPVVNTSADMDAYASF